MAAVAVQRHFGQHAGGGGGGGGGGDRRQGGELPRTPMPTPPPPARPTTVPNPLDTESDSLMQPQSRLSVLFCALSHTRSELTPELSESLSCPRPGAKLARVEHSYPLLFLFHVRSPPLCVLTQHRRERRGTHSAPPQNAVISPNFLPPPPSPPQPYHPTARGRKQAEGVQEGPFHSPLSPRTPPPPSSPRKCSPAAVSWAACPSPADDPPPARCVAAPTTPRPPPAPTVVAKGREAPLGSGHPPPPRPSASADTAAAAAAAPCHGHGRARLLSRPGAASAAAAAAAGAREASGVAGAGGTRCGGLRRAAFV